MRSEVTSTESGALLFHFEPEQGDCERDSPQMVGSEVHVRLPDDCGIDDIHPDLLALSALLLVLPWIGRELTLGKGVSQRFAEAVEEDLGVHLHPVDPALAARPTPDDGRPGLAFSGGVDSTAALSVMPRETHSVFLEQTAFSQQQASRQKNSLYKKEAALHACTELSGMGHAVDIVPCDLELIREPVGFPVDLSNALPLLCVADKRQLDSVGWGTIAESAYRIGAMGFTDYAERTTFTRWRRIFETVGLPIFNAVAGVSEVGTSIIARESPYGSLAQSCIRGQVGQPCGRCWKCFRKSLLDSALSGSWPSSRQLDAMFVGSEVRLYVNKIPLKHEDVLTYALGMYEGGHPLALALKRKVRGGEVDMKWLERWYPPSLDLVPQRYRKATSQLLTEYLEPMSETDMAEFRGWNLADVIESERYRTDAANLSRLLERHASSSLYARKERLAAMARGAARRLRRLTG